MRLIETKYLFLEGEKSRPSTHRSFDFWTDFTLPAPEPSSAAATVKSEIKSLLFTIQNT